VRWKGSSNTPTPRGSANKIFRGVALGANIVNLKVLNTEGRGTDSSVIQAVDVAISLSAAHNIRVINLSLGRRIYENYALDPLCQAVERAWKAGIVVVVAAGNFGRFSGSDGYATITSPANDPFVITVGALHDKTTLSRSDDTVATYSSKGPTLIDHVVKP
jgi:serine protease AprX